MLVLNILLFFILVINTNSQFLLVKLSDSNRPDGFRSGGIGPGKIGKLRISRLFLFFKIIGKFPCNFTENGGIDYNELARKDAENSESNFSEQGLISFLC